MDTNDTTKCYNSQYFPTLGLRVGLSFLSCLFIIGMIVIIVLLQKYKFFTQRLSLYLAITALAFSACAALDVTAKFSYTNSVALYYCRIIAFAQMATIWSFNMATAVIMIVVFIEVSLKKATDRFEAFFVFLIFGLPLLITWVPFVTGNYGPLGYICWLSVIDMETCETTTTGFVLNLVIYFIPTKFIMLILSSLLLVSLISVKRQRKKVKMECRQQNTRMQKQLESELRPLLLYPIIVFIANLLGFATLLSFKFNERSVPVLIMSVILTVVFQLQGTFITLAYTLEPDTRNKLKPRLLRLHCRRCWSYCRGGSEKTVHEYQTGLPRSDSLEDYLSPYRDVDEA